MHYTVGQRKGFDVPLSHIPLYVKETVPEENKIVVTAKDGVFEESLSVCSLNMFTDMTEFECDVKIRYKSPKTPARVTIKEGTATVSLYEPQFALEGMREIDKATIFEMQRDVFQQLYYNVRDKRAGLHERDAYEGLFGVIPPKEKRGLVMIDPPYEVERKDFPQLVDLIATAYKKWPTGVFAIWYPIKDRAMIDRFEKKMIKTGIRRQLICEVCVWPDDTPVGLNGCGLLVINPPWKFSEDADEALQWLFPHLRMSENGGHAAVRWLVGE
jgi:23S rRNA A2030 N6-methylase RlmJ